MKFSNRSKINLASCHEELKLVANEAIIDPPYDFMITSGYRSPTEQFELYKKGRSLINGRWERTGSVVTYKDGYIKKSKHNIYPAEAFDIAVLVNGKLTWEVDYYKELAEHIIEIAERMYENDMITNQVFWGGWWTSLKDYPHYQI